MRAIKMRPHFLATLHESKVEGLVVGGIVRQAELTFIHFSDI